MRFRYKITYLQLTILTWIARKIVTQSHRHHYNITMYYHVMYEAAKAEFREDNKDTLDCFLEGCHKVAGELDNDHTRRG